LGLLIDHGVDSTTTFILTAIIGTALRFSIL
jgi:hypothetical protein